MLEQLTDSLVAKDADLSRMKRCVRNVTDLLNRTVDLLTGERRKGLLMMRSLIEDTTSRVLETFLPWYGNEQGAVR